MFSEPLNYYQEDNKTIEGVLPLHGSVKISLGSKQIWKLSFDDCGVG